MFMSQNQEEFSVKSLIDIISTRRNGVDCIGLSGSERAYLLSRLYRDLNVPLIVIVSTQKDGERFLEDLRFFGGTSGFPLMYFPAYNILPFKFLSYHSETAAKRISTLYSLIENKLPPVVITTADALIQKIIPKQEMCDYAELIMVNEDMDRDLLIKKLISGGYVRSMLVEEPGDFCIRGGVLDIFSPLYSDPLRVEFFGDTVESLRFFSATSQRTVKTIREAIILPAREAILKIKSMDQVIARIRAQASAQDIPVSMVRDLVDRTKNEGTFPGIESLIPLIYPELDTFFDYVPENALFIQIEPKELEKAATESEEQATRNYLAACEESRLCVETEALYMKWSETQDILYQKGPLTFKMFSTVVGNHYQKEISLERSFSVKDNTDICMELKNPREKDNLLLPLADWIRDKKQFEYITFIVCSTKSQADRLISLLGPYGIQIEIAGAFSDVESDFRRHKGRLYLCIGQISGGFVWPYESMAIITEDEIFGARRHRRRRSREKVSSQILAFEDLKKRDLVVHLDHGIGRYEGLVKLKLNGSTNDFLLIVYRDGDKLYLPVDRMGMAQKYLGVDGITPVLDKMGGKSWERIKERVKKSAEKIAGALLKLYAVRKVKKGFSFAGIDSYFKDFEDGFPYEETADQFKAIDDVLQDMSKPTPMDRMVCGDVGYGKTEVALRASFLAVNNGKQVAVLVPTTVLAEQHFATFSSRFERYPVNIACLSRFRSLGHQKLIINNLKTGKIDIVVGTHRLLQKDVVFKDLGLFVLDEEQRFGVKHKEKLKKIRDTVDVLTLTATPIPRTLHMSLLGLRDISIISTPPEYRKAIITYISEFNDAVVTDAIRKELGKKGQIFFIHNNISSIWRIAKHLKELVPEVRLGVAHGRLGEDELEGVMLQFMNKEIDMLVCTTIVESGLDIPSANTILVNRADRFGLAQIYQLRGRVGRADEQAYAYLFIPNRSTLGKDAQKRLKVLMEHSDLGSGFQIAMSDLKIRGGGTILGASQSGHIAAVGYDMFLKLMEHAISDLKGEPVQESLEPEINIAISAFLSESYIPDIDQRLSAYRRLAKMRAPGDIIEFKTELIDRFGVLPVEASNLLVKIMLKILAIKAGVRRIDLVGQDLFLYVSQEYQKYPEGIMDMIESKGDHIAFSPDHVLKAKLPKQNLNGLLVQTKNILKEIIQHVNF